MSAIVMPSSSDNGSRSLGLEVADRVAVIVVALFVAVIVGWLLPALGDEEL